MATKTKPRINRELISLAVNKFIDDYIYRIDLDADYQREKIWSRRDQEKLIDSIIQNIDIPKLYLARVKDNENFDYECIDGKQRMATLLNFFKPELPGENPLTVRVAGERYTYEELREELSPLAKKIEDYELTFVIYPEIDDENFIREIFRRLQLGVRLNSGELLKSHTGAIRDFIYREMGKDAPFLRHTKLSEKRFSRQFALAQICINSFRRWETGDFVRARYDDLEDFFKENYDLNRRDKNLLRIRQVLTIMDEHFGDQAQSISSRAVAISAYLFVEGLYLEKKRGRIPKFAKFYVKLLADVKDNLKLLSRFRQPTNPTILEEFQKYISQASVEPYAIKRRNRFLERAFEHYLAPRTKGRIIRSN
ncbi:DUF262 domain-containing protein [Acidobacteriia bacterium AH_259_A11_L15]|nr:DUF262 domain-containing protein [Acidobacteriia bacterium AH_259_A11_L15]